MNSFFACILCVLTHQALSQDLITLNESSISYNPEAPDCRSTVPVSCTPQCSGIKVCFSNSLRTIDCTKYKPFCDPKTLTCSNTPSTCNNTVIAPSFRCPARGYYPYALDCTKFWDCNGKVATERSCTSGVFDPLLKQCRLNIICYNFSYVSGLCSGNENRFVVHPMNPAIHVLCQKDFPEIGLCPDHTIFNTDLNRCQWQCTSEGMFKDPLKNSCYYECEQNGYNQWKSDYICCKSDEIFDDFLKTCM